MRAFVGTSFGSVDNFVLDDLPTPEPGEGLVRIRIQATALGFVDGLMVQGRYQLEPSLPYVPGGEIVGVVEAIGPGVEALRVGQRVVTWQWGGGLAEQTVVSAVDVDVLKDGISSIAAASMLVDYQTSHHALFDVAAISAGDTVLVLGATGGVGSAAVQMAARAGCCVIAAASTHEKRLAALALGAHDTVDYSLPDWRTELKRKAPEGVVDVVFDPIGGPMLEPAFRSLGKEGRYLVVGFASGSIPALPVNLVLLKNASLLGVEIRHLLGRDPAKARRVRRSLFSMVHAGHLKAPAVVAFSLDRSREAVLATASRDRIGKVVVVPGPV
ncbi:MAG: NADPH:quinone oxidoreductase family protein [Burkholderiales bacterium]|nr:NADPH:quinone oxidoreductase family protein [Burkholderiales bacterium]MDE2395440.1 NADPH:quinone oxidoreductase family protein [Burkholderiales bacterium]MDE2454546.1 NADPH:quinone oxidoreductase family protein [Burkholderiales bacterium]